MTLVMSNLETPKLTLTILNQRSVSLLLPLLVELIMSCFVSSITPEISGVKTDLFRPRSRGSRCPDMPEHVVAFLAVPISSGRLSLNVYGRENWRRLSLSKLIRTFARPEDSKICCKIITGGVFCSGFRVTLFVVVA